MSPVSIAIDRVARKVAKLLAEGDREEALRLAMASVEPLLESPSDELRVELRRKLFRHIEGAQYQTNDFESVDYGLFELSKDLPLFRGPKPPPGALARGDYFCVMGAAQTFGRLAREPWPNVLSRAIGLPVLNLSRGGVGPEFFLRRELLPLVQGARFVILQVMSGRSVGCFEFPGGRLTRMGSETVNRWVVLNRVWREDRAQAVKYVQHWNRAYFEAYRQLRSFIESPTALLWMSSREPWQWAPKHLLGELQWGSFPQLVGSDLYMQVAGLFAYCAKCITPRTSERPLSRVTGKPCPYFGTAPKANTTVLQTEFVYYPSSESHLAVARRLESWAGNQVVRTKVHPRQDASPHQPRIGENAHEAPDALAAHVGASAL